MGHPPGGQFVDACDEPLIQRRRRVLHLRFGERPNKLSLDTYELSDPTVCKLKRVDELVLRDLERAALHHDDRLFRARDD